MRSGIVPIEPAPSVITRSSGPRDLRDRRRQIVERLDQRHRPPGLAHCRLDRLGGDAGNRRPRRRRRCRSGRPRRRRRAPSPNSRQQIARARVAMRLEDDDDAAVEAGAGRGDDGGNLGRVMAVVVDDHHAARFAAQLEAALGAAEILERRSRSSRTARRPRGRPRPRRARSAGCGGRARAAAARRARARRPSRVACSDAAARAERLERHAARRSRRRRCLRARR